eukprot:gb/GEZN01002103.1/.p1 GENE.gb/GEZN01002103.1/~~gb/GEZN01002103.1/.p1  ORF type:complete len:832 (+),score=143.65 gb/GEZN01002103.1/:137-2497(+)
MPISALKKALEPFHCSYILYPSPESTAHYTAARVAFSSADKAAVAAKQLGAMKFGTKNPRVLVLDENKASRLIVRNLSFQATSPLVERLFKRVCPGTEFTVHLPMKKDGANCGFAFVQWQSFETAAKALEATNQQKIAGRVVAVDWTLNKSDYESRSQQALARDMKVQQSGQSPAKPDQRDVSHDVAVCDDEDEDDEEEEQNDEKEVYSQEIEKEGDGGRSDRERVSDAKKGLTVFIRNLAYQTTEDELRDKFMQFGGVKLSKIVMDQTLHRSRGTAFVQFHSRAGVRRALIAAGAPPEPEPKNARKNRRIAGDVSSSVSPGIELCGRQLIVTLAVDRDEAAKLTDQGVKRRADKRNLYLAREGLINEDSVAAEEMSKGDLAKRTKAQTEKREKLKNPNYVVSRTRLSIRNIPAEYSEKNLKELFQKFAMSGTGRRAPVKQVKIVRDKERIDSKGVRRSKRYGFVEFETHDAALSALRKLNNNPRVWGKDTRPIVEFALDDQRKLLIRRKKLEKTSGQAEPQMQKKQEEAATTPEDKRRCFLCRKVGHGKAECPQFLKRQSRKVTSDKAPSRTSTGLIIEPPSAGESGPNESAAAVKKRKRKERKKERLQAVKKRKLDVVELGGKEDGNNILPEKAVSETDNLGKPEESPWKKQRTGSQTPKKKSDTENESIQVERTVAAHSGFAIAARARRAAVAKPTAKTKKISKDSMLSAEVASFLEGGSPDDEQPKKKEKKQHTASFLLRKQGLHPFQQKKMASMYKGRGGSRGGGRAKGSGAEGQGRGRRG